MAEGSKALDLKSRVLCTGGSNPSRLKRKWCRGSTPALGAGGRGFESLLPYMIRKDSYRVSVPRNVRLFLSEYPPAILIRGPLGCAVIGVPSSRVFSVYKGWLK